MCVVSCVGSFFPSFDGGGDLVGSGSGGLVVVVTGVGLGTSDGVSFPSPWKVENWIRPITLFQAKECVRTSPPSPVTAMRRLARI